MGTKASIIWFRLDLRLDDNPALRAAIERGGPVIPLYIWTPKEEDGWTPGGASRWWLHHSLLALDAALQRHGSRLIVRHGATQKELAAVVRTARAGAAFWNRRHEPAARRQEESVAARLRELGVDCHEFNGNLLMDPALVTNRQGGPFRVYSAFWRSCGATASPPEPVPCPKRIPAPQRWPRSLAIERLGLLPRPDWAAGLRDAWTPGAPGATRLLDQVCGGTIENYATDRDRPGITGTSRLSPHLHFGEISVREVWHMVSAKPAAAGSGLETFLKQLFWREFGHHLLYHFPHTTDLPLREDFAAFPWRSDDAQLRSWQRGETGYPLVDAGMRELWTTGWMHNRVRMVVASLLVKHLLIPWQEGARWFWDTLVDADLSNNTLGWQWTAGCGADAAPYFRIFNPVAQGERFDPNGAYVRRWIPELAALPPKWIHKPWQAPAAVLSDANVALGRNYPHPIVDHAEARARALAAYAQMRRDR